MINYEELVKFGTNLRKIRDSKGLSQQQLADISNISKKTIQRIENAKYSVTLDILISISNGLNIDLKELADYK